MAVLLGVPHPRGAQELADPESRAASLAQAVTIT